MTDMISDGAVWLDGMRNDHLTVAVVYSRGSDSVAVQATIGSTDFRLDDGTGASVRYVSRDFLIRTADLVLDGSAIEPRRGDEIQETKGGVVYTHEVMGPDNDEPVWRYSDSDRLVMRIHTKQTDYEAEA